MKKVVLIGGGHGLSNLVKGFKDEKLDLTVVVSSSDDGGHTGKIRDEFGLVAVGDLRMVLNELINEDGFLKQVFNYRFDFLHGIKGVSLGNLIITAMLLKYKDIDKVISCFRDQEGFKANVFLSSNSPLTLCAECESGDVIKGEHVIGESNKEIKKIYLENKAECNQLMLDKIKKADIIVLCPGSLYTSVGSVVCVEDIKNAINNSEASLVYVCNIMTQDGETFGYKVEDHEKALTDIIGKKIDRVIVNDGDISNGVLKRYKEENSGIVLCECEKQYYEFYDLVEICENKVRHNSELTKKIILSSDRQNKNIML